MPARAFLIKTPVSGPKGASFTFTAHKTMYGGNAKFYRQATNKIGGITPAAAALLEQFF